MPLHGLAEFLVSLFQIGEWDLVRYIGQPSQNLLDQEHRVRYVSY